MKCLYPWFLLGVTAVSSAEDVRLNKTIELLAAGKAAVGRFAFDMSNGNAIEIATSPADFVIIDVEHSPYDIAKLREFLQQMTNKRRILEKRSLQMDVTPIVRLPSSDVSEVATLAKQVLNLGAFGLMFPTVDTRDEALQAVRASRFPPGRGDESPEPVGLRGFEPFQQAMWYWGLDPKEYFERADLWPLDPKGELLVVIQIESVEGVENIDEILSVPGIGAVLVGSFDLSASLGIVGQMQHPDLAAAVNRVRRACVRRGIPVGSTAGPIEQRIEAGETFLFGGQSNEELTRARDLTGR